MAGEKPVDATVQQVLKGAGDPWTMRNGDVVRTYVEVLLEGAARTCPVIVPADVSLADGMQLRGWYNERSGSFKVAKDRPPTGGGSQGSSNGASQDFDRRPDHPLVMAQRLHTASLAEAFKAIEQMFTFQLEDVQRPTSKDDYLRLLEGVATWVKSTYPQAVLDRAAEAVPVQDDSDVPFS